MRAKSRRRTWPAYEQAQVQGKAPAQPTGTQLQDSPLEREAEEAELTPAEQVAIENAERAQAAIAAAHGALTELEDNAVAYIAQARLAEGGGEARAILSPIDSVAENLDALSQEADSFIGRIRDGVPGIDDEGPAAAFAGAGTKDDSANQLHRHRHPCDQ